MKGWRRAAASGDGGRSAKLVLLLVCTLVALVVLNLVYHGLTPSLLDRITLLRSAPTMAPTRPVPGVTLPRSTAVEFECLEDDDQLWRARVRRTNRFRDQLCPAAAAAATTLADTRAKHIPVVFTFWAKDGLYGREDRVLPSAALNMVALAANTAARFNDDVIVLYLYGQPDSLRRRDPQQPVISKHDLPVRLRQNVRVITAATWDRQASISRGFRMFGPQQYHHSSTNGYEYELFCFQRWFAVLRMLEKLGLEEVFAADNDVLVLTNVTREMEQCYSGCETTGHLVYAQHFRLPVLRRFLDFVLDFYGHSASGRAKGYTIAGTVARYSVVSDMYLHVLFAESELQRGETDPARQCVGQKHANVRAPEPYQLASPFYGDLAHGYLQDDLGLLLLQREWPHSVSGANWTVAPAPQSTMAPTSQPRLMQVAHFQGPENKLIMMRCAEALAKPSSSSSSFWSRWG